MIATCRTRLRLFAGRGALLLVVGVTCCTPLAVPATRAVALAAPPARAVATAAPAATAEGGDRPRADPAPAMPNGVTAGPRATPVSTAPSGASGVATPSRSGAAPRATATGDESQPIATPLPLSAFWERLRAMQFVPALDHLRVLPPDQRNDPFFAINDALAADDTTAPLMRGVGASMDRLELRWDLLEPARGDFRFAPLDALMQSAVPLQFAVLAVVDGTPNWAASAPAMGAASPPQGLDQPALLADGSPNSANPWAVFIATVAQRYAGRIAAWEIWNEPNSAEFWGGTPQQYARLYATAQTALNRPTPGAPVLVGGMVSDDGAFLSAVATALCPDRACPPGELHDIAWHVYDNPSDIPRVVALTRSLLQPYGIQPALWVTEANVPVNDPEAPADAVTGPDAVSLEQQAAFVLQAAVLARAAGVRSLAFYRASDVDDRGRYWGLLRGDMTARPALLAYRTAAQWLSHARLLQLGHPQPAVTLARFCRGGSLVNVAWNSAALATSISLVVPAPQASLVDMTGSTTPVTVANGAVMLALPAATPPTAETVPLGQPRLLVVANACNANDPQLKSIRSRPA